MSLDKNLNKILIIDFGSQFTQLIARRIRESGVYSEIISHKKVKNKNIDNSIKGIILSGGPLNVYQINKYSFDKRIIENQIPVLGICFGHQILSKLNGGRVKQSKYREFGLAKYKGKVDKVIFKLVGGLRSSMGYLGSKQIKYLRYKPQFVKITKAGFYESMVHNVDIVKSDSKY